MSYQVLARKWRPKNFKELVGQQQTAQALINALDSERLHHAYLFTGTRGVGKTTIARILSKSLNCEKGITSDPCGECSSCVEISQGNFVDLLEIDAASKTKVEDTRELLDNVQYRPTRGRYKVYLIDEVHMLSGHSFNALLKTLEEPPPHVIFLLATTDPQKMPVTVLSRCLQFHLKRMQEDEIINHLEMILNAEQLEFEPQALAPIAKGADGSMRDALSLLDQAIAYCGQVIDQQTVFDMLGSIDKEYSFQLLNALNANDVDLLFKTIEKIASFSPDYDELLADWLSLLHQIAVCQATNQFDDEKVEHLSGLIKPADLQLFYQLSLHARRDLSYAPHPKQGFEMAMLRILSFKPHKMVINNPPTAANASDKTSAVGNYNQTESSNDNVKKKVTELQNIENKLTEESESVTTQSVQEDLAQNNIAQKQITQDTSTIDTYAKENVLNDSFVEEKTAIDKTEQSSKPHLVPSPIENLRKNIRQLNNNPTPQQNDNIVSQSTTSETSSLGVQNFHEKSSLIENSAEVNPEPQVTSVVIEKIPLELVANNNWYQVTNGLTIEGQGLQVLLNSNAEYQNETLNIRYLEKVEPLLTTSARENIHQALNDYFENTNLKINLQEVSETSETPKERANRLHEIAIDEAHQALLNDPQISYLLTHLNGSLARDSIKLLH